MNWRIATVDMGTNTLKFGVTEIDNNGNERILDAQAETIRLGAGIATSGIIEPERILRAIAALQSYELTAREIGATVFLGVATAAFRIASNGHDLLDEIARQTAWDVRVISGEEEARLAFLGLARYTPTHGDALLADVGGGSTELLLVGNRQLRRSQSLNLGSGTLADTWFENDPPGMLAVESAIDSSRSVLMESSVLPGVSGLPLYLSGGNGQFLSELAAWDDLAIPFTPDAFPRLVEALAGIDSSRTAKQLGIPEERARMLPAGAAIAKALIQLAQPSSIQAVPSGIRGGMIEEWLTNREALNSDSE